MTSKKTSLIKWDKRISNIRQRLNNHYSKVPDVLDPIAREQLMAKTYHTPGRATRHYAAIYDAVKRRIPVCYAYYYSDMVI